MFQPIQNTRHVSSRHCPIRMDRHRFVRAIINDGQAIQTAAISQAIKHKVDRPHFILSTRPQQWLAIRQPNFLPLAPAHHQLLFPVQTPHALQVDCQPFLPQPQVNHPVAVSPVPMCHVHDALPQVLVAILPALIPEQARAHADHAQGMAF